MPRSLSINVQDDEIKGLVFEWSEALAEKRFAEALKMFDCCEGWTPEELEKWIINYGSPEPFKDGRTFELTSLLALENAQDIIANRIDVDRENLYGLDPEQYLGMVHYDGVPLNGKPSDLTARFHIKKVGDDKLTLEFLDIHVM